MGQPRKQIDGRETPEEVSGATDRRSVSGNAPARSGEAEAGSPSSGPPSSASDGKTRRFRGWRGWLLRLSLAVVSPVVFFGLLEAALRLGGYGYPTGFFMERDAGGTCTTNDHFGCRFFPRPLVRYPYPCVLSAKPAGSIRSKTSSVGDPAMTSMPDA